MRNSPALETLLGGQLGVERGPVAGEDGGVGTVTMLVGSEDERG